MYLFTDLSVSATCTVSHPLIFSSQLLLGGQYSIYILEVFFEIINFGRILREINNLLPELFYINM